MGIRSSLGKALVNGWNTFNHEMTIGLAEHQARSAVAEAQRRAQYIDSRITGDYAPRANRPSGKVTFS